MTDVRIVTEPLGGSPLSRLLQSGDAPPDWFAPAPRNADAWTTFAQSRAKERDWATRWRALEPAIAATGAAAARLKRVCDAGGVVVTTGQQPGLFGGPIYTWSKAVSALALADAIERETGVPTVAIFWAATDDADFAEAATTIVARRGGTEVLRSTNAPAAGMPMSLAPLGDVHEQLARLVNATGSAADTRALDAVRAAYGDASCTVGDAYVALLRTLLAPLGIPVLDASHEAVRRESDETLRAALRNADVIERALSERGKAIGARGLDVQVEQVKGLSLVFRRDDGIKRRLSVAESSATASDARALLTPNVLLRPIVERELLPTVAYVAGPGELAYFAQSTAVAGAMQLASPAAVPRWSCTLIEPHVARLLERLGVEPQALTQPDALEGEVARAAMSPASSGAIEELRRVIGTLPDTLGEEANPLGLGAAVEGAMQSLLHRVDRLERRLVAGIKRRETARLEDVATLRANLMPMGKRQERALNLIPTLARNGMELLTEMREAAAPHADALVLGQPSGAQ